MEKGQACRQAICKLKDPQTSVLTQETLKVIIYKSHFIASIKLGTVIVSRNPQIGKRFQELKVLSGHLQCLMQNTAQLTMAFILALVTVKGDDKEVK